MYLPDHSSGIWLNMTQQTQLLANSLYLKLHEVQSYQLCCFSVLGRSRRILGWLIMFCETFSRFRLQQYDGELGSSTNDNVIMRGRACYVTFYIEMLRLAATVVVTLHGKVAVVTTVLILSLLQSVVIYWLNHYWQKLANPGCYGMW